MAEWICEVDRGHLYPYKGNYSTYLETKAARAAAQGQREERLAKRIAAELDWVRSSPKARQAKNKARLARYEEMEAEARASQKVDYTDIRIPVGPRLGSKVLVAEHLHKEFDGRVLIDDLSFTLPRNGIVGVIGPNGVGKTTLFKTIVGLEPLTSGNLEIAELDWVRSSPKARQAKNKARLARYEEMEAEARASQKVDYTDIRIPVGPRLGSKVLVAEHLH